MNYYLNPIKQEAKMPPVTSFWSRILTKLLLVLGLTSRFEIIIDERLILQYTLFTI